MNAPLPTPTSAPPNTEFNAAQLARKIDHTLLKPEATLEEIDRIIAQAKTHQFASVCVQPVHTKHIAQALQGTGVLPCVVIGFPQGANKSIIKAIEATAAVKDGAREIDVVAFLPFLLRRDVQATKTELLEIVRAARAADSSIVIKVIVESALLVANRTDGEGVIEDACRAVRESGCDFIKTSTGYHPAGGASTQVVGWMKQYAGGLRVKASGGIRDLAAARAMLDAGADRLGLSAGVSIMSELVGNEVAGNAMAASGAEKPTGSY